MHWFRVLAGASNQACAGPSMPLQFHIALSYAVAVGMYTSATCLAVHASRDFQASSPFSAQEAGTKQARARDLLFVDIR